MNAQPSGQQALRQFFRELPQWKAHSRIIGGELCLDTECVKAFAAWSMLQGYGDGTQAVSFLEAFTKHTDATKKGTP